MELTRGSEYKVINPFAPYKDRVVTFEEYEQGSAYPIVCSIEVRGEVFPCCYREGELEPVDATFSTGPIPVVVA